MGSEHGEQRRSRNASGWGIRSAALTATQPVDHNRRGGRRGNAAAGPTFAVRRNARRIMLRYTAGGGGH